MQIPILHESDEIVVINKPLGIDAQNSVPNRDSIVSWLQEHYHFSGLVHRLDINTTGVMVCAKNPKSAQKLVDLMKEGLIRRTYHALCWGKLSPSKGRFNDDLDGQTATTNYSTLETYANASLLECQLLTGRKHQIRKHLLLHGHPILGDFLYKQKGSHLLGRRPMLHAYRIQIEDLVVEAPYPEDFEKLKTRLKTVGTPKNLGFRDR